MNIKKLFSRKAEGRQEATEQPAPQPLRIEGIAPAPLTPEPDEAELAAQAVLELLMEEAPLPSPLGGKSRHRKHKHKEGPAADASPSGDERGASYYKHLAEQIRRAHAAAHWRTVRFLAFCEQEIQKPHLPATGPGSLALLETEILKRLDVVEREGGELKKRWQHCLATVTVRLMEAQRTEADADDAPPEG